MENANHMTRITLLLSALAITTLASCAKKPEFSEFTPEGTSIVVQMPRPIEHKTKEAQLGDEDVTAHAYMASFDGVNYVLNHQTIPEALQERMRRVQTQDALDSAIAQLVQTSGGTVMEQSGVSLPGATKGYLGREAKLKLPDGRSMMLIRIFPAGESYIQIAATFPAEPSYNQELYARRFVESARLR